MSIEDRLNKLEARVLPAWCPVLTVPCALGENWDEAVEKALAEAPEPPQGCSYALVVPETLTGDAWAEYAAAEMAAYHANNESNNMR